MLKVNHQQVLTFKIKDNHNREEVIVIGKYQDTVSRFADLGFRQTYKWLDLQTTMQLDDLIVDIRATPPNVIDIESITKEYLEAMKNKIE